MTDNKRTVKLGEICHEVKLTTNNPITDGFERYIGLEHLDSNSLKIKRWGMIAEDNPSFTRIFKKGQILFGKRRPYLRKAAIANFDGICSSDILVLEATPKLEYTELLPFIIQSEKLWEHAIKTSSGSLSPRTKWNALKNLEIPLPSIEKQAEFAELLLSSEKALQLTQSTITSFDRLRTQIANQYLTGLKRLPNTSGEWQRMKLKELGEIKTGLTYSPKDITHDERSLLVLRSSNIKGSSFVLDDKVHVNCKVNYESLAKPNDILICVRNGSKSLIGKTALIPKTVPYSTHGAFMSMYRTESYRFIFHLFQSIEYRKQVLKNLGATINSINNKDLLNFEFNVPNKKERELISDFLEEFDSTASVLSKKEDYALQMKNLLIERLFNI